MATVSMSKPIVVATAGVVVLEERFRFGVIGLMVVAAAAVVMALGVIGLAWHTTAPSSRPDAAAKGASASSGRAERSSTRR